MDRTLKNFIHSKFIWRNTKIYNPNRDLIHGIARAVNTMACRRLTVLGSGHLSPVLADASWDDGNYILLGVDVPLVLRSESGGYKLLGTCYVQGVVRGEAVKVSNAKFVELPIIHREQRTQQTGDHSSLLHDLRRM